MRRPLSLRQIEAFKAVIEHGTVTQAATVLHISQAAVSKMIANLEADAGLLLFDRVKARLIPTEQAALLYEEVERVFQGVQQVENAVDSIRRRTQGRLAIGVMPALSGSFVQRVATGILQRHPSAFCVFETRSSQRITDWLLARRLDAGLINSKVDNVVLVSEPLLELALVCAMPAQHPLAHKACVRAADLDGTPFVSFDPESTIGRRIHQMFAEQGVRPEVKLISNVASTLCGFVAAGHGVSLVHPLMIDGYAGEIVVRPFEPSIPVDFWLCRTRESRNARLVEAFAVVVREIASDLLARFSVP